MFVIHTHIHINISSRSTFLYAYTRLYTVSQSPMRLMMNSIEAYKNSSPWPGSIFVL